MNRELAGYQPRTVARNGTAGTSDRIRRSEWSVGASPPAAHPHAKGNCTARAERHPDDPALAALYFQFGRYFLISSSRPGHLPANLQGLWNDSFTPPWFSDFTININTEMNYWPAEVGNLAECHEPLFDLIDMLREPGRHTARERYGCRGLSRALGPTPGAAPICGPVPACCGPMRRPGCACTCGNTTGSPGTRSSSPAAPTR